MVLNRLGQDRVLGEIQLNTPETGLNTEIKWNFKNMFYGFVRQRRQIFLFFFLSITTCIF